ncbi:MAG: metalloregulator ArsR/SmtB family transcription factor [Planctomycetes bacterium]|nr:metalloregulator ArsR/SmtB family transcription factor [Planctomycetota bacterium]
MTTPSERSAEAAPAQLFQALAHPTRAAILDRLAGGPLRTLDLAGEMPGSRFATRKHLEVLANAGLVVRSRRGREVWNHLNPIPLQRLHERWVAPRAASAARMLLALEGHLAEEPRTMSAPLPAQVVTIELSLVLPHPRERVWQALVHEIDAWWRRDFLTSAKTRRFVLEPKVGGRVYEDAGDGEGLQWGQVIGISAPEKLDLAGYLSPEFGGPATSYHVFRLNARKDGGTELRFTDAIHGRVDAAQAQMLADGWRLLLAEGLKPYLERRAS